MFRSLLMLAGAVLLLFAGLLIANAREREATTITRTCTDAALGKAAEIRRGLGLSSWPADISQCTYERRWDMILVAGAGFALAGGLGFLAFGLSRQQVPT